MFSFRRAINNVVKLTNIHVAWSDTVTRSVGRHKRPFLRALYRRRMEEGPEKERRRSEFSNWDYGAEIFAFGKRLNEDFDENLLRTSFMHRSYVEAEKDLRRETLEVDDDLNQAIADNSELVAEGASLISNYAKAFLRHSYPFLLEEYILSIHDHLTNTQSLAYVGAHIGVKDLILSTDYPPQLETIANTFKGIVGALQRSQSTERAQRFVRDLVLTRLASEDVNQLFEIDSPGPLLQAILAKEGRPPPEPRLLRQSATNTVLACYHVGIFSDKELLGQSPGESPEIAEQEAMREALRTIFKTSDSRGPLALRGDDVSVPMETRNRSISEFISPNLQ